MEEKHGQKREYRIVASADLKCSDEIPRSDFLDLNFSDPIFFLHYSMESF